MSAFWVSSFALMVLGSGGGAPTIKGAQAPPMDLSKYAPYTAKVTADGDYVMEPPFTNAPELTVRDDVPHGKIYHLTMDSMDSKIYPGIAKDKPGVIVPYKRSVTVYVPAQYVAGMEAPLIETQDSMGSRELPTILDNMIADHRLPPIVAVMLNSGGSDAQGSERGLEYDTLSPWYAQFIEWEVLPFVSKETGVKFTKDPNGRMSMGGSSGGICAFTMAWYRPDLYHRCLIYSGTFVNQQWPPDPVNLRGGWEYHDHLVRDARSKPIRIWMEVGEHDLRYNDPESTWHNWPLANVRMAAALKDKHYHYQFVFARNAVHVDGGVVRQTLPQALEYVWKGYPIKR